MKALWGRGIVAGCTRIRVWGAEWGHLSPSKVVISTLVDEAVWTRIVSWRRRWTHRGESIRHILGGCAIGLMRALTHSSMLRSLLVWIRGHVSCRRRRCRRRIIRVGVSTKHDASSTGVGMVHWNLAIEYRRRRIFGLVRSHAVELAVVRRNEGRRHLVGRSRC